MAINYLSVKAHFEQEGWELLSDKYKNLTTPLKVKCPNGHISEQTYEEWRSFKNCNECTKTTLNLKDKISKKDKRDYRILALDAATKVTGFSLFENNKLIKYGIYIVPKCSSTIERINKVKEWLKDKIYEWEPDFVGLEHIQLQNFGGATQVELYRVLANLQGVLQNLLFNENIETELVYSSEWRHTFDIKGKNRDEKKKNTQEKVEKWYGIKVSEDEADAITIGRYFVENMKNKKNIWGENYD